jgi:hypothetical protein
MAYFKLVSRYVNGASEANPEDSRCPAEIRSGNFPRLRLSQLARSNPVSSVTFVLMFRNM